MHKGTTIGQHKFRHLAVLLYLVITTMILALLLAATIRGAARAAANTQEEQTAIPAEEPDLPQSLLVGIVPGTPLAEISSYLEANGLELGRVWPDLALVEARPSAAAQAASAENATVVVQAGQAALAQAPFVRYAEFDDKVYAASAPIVSSEIGPVVEPPLQEPPPNDPLLRQQWAVERVRAIDAWNISLGDPQMAIAIIDSGYHINHPEFDLANLWLNTVEAGGVAGVDDDGNGFVDDIRGWDWVDDDNVPDDRYGHGTHVQGVVIASTNNNQGITGIGRNLRVLPLRILDSRGSGQISDLVDALEYAREQGVRIINLSLVIRSDSSPLRDAIVASYNSGALIVAAAGNSASGTFWPAAYTQTVAVAATTIADARASFSNINNAVDIAAPGENITSTYLNGGYAILNGTSMATPHVSALAALLWSLRPDYSRQQIIDTILATANDINASTHPGPDAFLGAGRIDNYAALLAASQGIRLTIPDPSDAFVYVGEPVNYIVKATTPAPGSIPIEGAVLYQQIWTAEAGTPEPITPLQRATTASDGTVLLAFTAPITPGNYIVRSQVGQTVVDLPLNVQVEPASIQLSLDRTSLVAGNDTALLTVRLLNDEGQLETGEIPVSLATTLGHFGDNLTAKSVIVQNGVYTTTYHAGLVSGTAHITAESGRHFAATQIPIKPGSPGHLFGPEPLHPVLSQAATTIPIIFTVTDAHGNIVEDGILVQAFSNTGTLEPREFRTVNGRAETSLTILPGEEGPITIWATIPGTFLQTRVDIAVVHPRIWMPVISTTP